MPLYLRRGQVFWRRPDADYGLPDKGCRGFCLQGLTVEALRHVKLDVDEPTAQIQNIVGSKHLKCRRRTCGLSGLSSSVWHVVGPGG